MQNHFFLSEKSKQAVVYNQIMTQEEAINFWITSAQHNFSTAQDMFKTGHFDWCLFMWHLVIEKLLKGLISAKGETPIATHNLLKLAKQASVSLPGGYEDYLKEITTFNLEARYDDYKFAFYRKATKDFTTKWTEVGLEIKEWLEKEIDEYK